MVQVLDVEEEQARPSIELEVIFSIIISIILITKTNSIIQPPPPPL